MRTTWAFHTAGKYIFGRNSLGRLGKIVCEVSAERVLIVTDTNLAKAGILNLATAPLAEADIGVDIFDKGEAEPTVGIAEECIEFARRNRPDAIVAIGGGSNMDLAKMTATVLTHGGSCLDYAGDNKIPGPILPTICVPTTAGSGSEVSAAAVLTNSAEQVKFGILSNHLRPTVAIVDPLLSASCPRQLTADSGIDVLTHAIEAFTAIDNADYPLPDGESDVRQGSNPMSDTMAERAIELVGRHLVRAVEQPDDLAAREGMALAASLGALAFSNSGVAAVHALEYPLGVLTHCSHGAGNGLLLPFVMRHNKPACTERLARVAQLLGKNVTGLNPNEAADCAIEAVERLKEKIGTPLRLHDLNVKSDQIDDLAKKAFLARAMLRANPRRLKLDDLKEILRAAY